MLCVCFTNTCLVYYSSFKPILGVNNNKQTDKQFENRTSALSFTGTIDLLVLICMRSLQCKKFLGKKYIFILHVLYKSECLPGMNSFCRRFKKCCQK